MNSSAENYVRTGPVFYPENLRYYARKLAFTRNQVFVDPMNQTSSAPSNTVIFNVPPNSLVNPNMTMRFLSDSTHADTGMPRNVESVIERVQVIVGGRTVSDISQYGVLFNQILNARCGQDKALSRFVYQDSSRKFASGAQPTAAQTHFVPDWLGFLGSSEPTYLDTALTGPIQIRLTFGGLETLGSGAAAADAAEMSYTNIRAYFDVATMDDGQMYRSLTTSRLLDGGALEIPFKNYFTFQGARTNGSGTLRGSIISRSIDRLLITQRKPYETAAGTAGNVPFNLFIQDNLTTGIYFELDGKRYPHYTPGNTGEQLQLTRAAWGCSDDYSSGDSLTAVYVDATPIQGVPTEAAYTGVNWQFATALNDDDSDRVASGYDTKGIASSLVCTYTGQAPSQDNDLYMFAECTSLMVVRAGQVIDVIS